MKEAENTELRTQQAQLIEKNELLMCKTSNNEKYICELNLKIANQEKLY